MNEGEWLGVVGEAYALTGNIDLARFYTDRADRAFADLGNEFARACNYVNYVLIDKILARPTKAPEMLRDLAGACGWPRVVQALDWVESADLPKLFEDF